MIVHVSTFWRYKWLLYELVLRDLKIKYRSSVLGYLWSLLNPLMMMTVLTIVFSTLFRFDIPNYPVYLLSGQLIYSFFSEATNMSMSSIINSASLIKKVYIPKYTFPVSRVLSSFVTLLLSLLAMVIVMVVTQVKFTWVILFFPIPLIYILVFSIGMGLLLSVLAVYFRDVIHLYSVLLSAWMYLTPIMYPINMVPDYVKRFIFWNPMYYFVEIFRQIVLYGEWPSLEMHLICLGFDLLALVTGLFVFYKNQKNFILHV